MEIGAAAELGGAVAQRAAVADDDLPHLYLGKAYYAVGPARLATNFFVLERLRPAPTMLDR